MHFTQKPALSAHILGCGIKEHSSDSTHTDSSISPNPSAFSYHSKQMSKSLQTILLNQVNICLFFLSHLLKNTVESHFLKASLRCPRISANLHLLLSSVSLTPLPVSAGSHSTI